MKVDSRRWTTTNQRSALKSLLIQVSKTTKARHNVCFRQSYMQPPCLSIILTSIRIDEIYYSLIMAQCWSGSTLMIIIVLAVNNDDMPTSTYECRWLSMALCLQSADEAHHINTEYTFFMYNQSLARRGRVYDKSRSYTSTQSVCYRPI
jgi:hypothetical protein